MEDLWIPLIVTVLAGAVSALVGIVVFGPFLLWMSWNVYDQTSWSFNWRAFVASQVIFWGALVFGYFVDPRSIAAFVGNGIPFIFNFFLCIYATRIGMRAAMAIRNRFKGRPDVDNDGLDEMSQRLKHGEHARDGVSKAADLLK